MLGRNNIDNMKLGTLKENIYKSFMSKCMQDIQNIDILPKMRTFKTFKKEYKFENYLANFDNTNHTLALLRFRISSHNLRIETGRYTRPKTPPDSRLCLYCTSQAVEDENHFIFNRSLYTNERPELLNVFNDLYPDAPSLPQSEQFILLMSSNEPELLEALGKYVYKCFIKRNSAEPAK